MTSPTQRTLLYLRRRGCLAAVVERFNAYVTRPDGGKGVRMDLFGFLDVIAVEPNRRGVTGYQVCRSDDIAAHEAKIRDEKRWPKAQQWLRAGNRIYVVGWAKRGQHSKKWTMNEREIQ